MICYLISSISLLRFETSKTRIYKTVQTNIYEYIELNYRIKTHIHIYDTTQMLFLV